MRLFPGATHVTPYVPRKVALLSHNYSPSITGHGYQVSNTLPHDSQPLHHDIFPDKIGRKPVVLAGTIGIATATLLMGLSRSLVGVLFARSLGTQCVTTLSSSNFSHHTASVSWILFGKYRSRALRNWRDYRFHEPSRRISHLRPLLASG